MLMPETFRHYERIKNRVGHGLCVKQNGQLDFSAPFEKSEHEGKCIGYACAI